MMHYQISERTSQFHLDEGKVFYFIDNWKKRSSFLIEILQDVQTEYHYLPKPVLELISKELNVPLTRIYHIATFFKAFSLEPRGEHIIQVCLGTACHVKGAVKILDSVEREIGIKPGKTTKDYKFGLEAVRCLGCCGLAAVVTVDKELYSNVKPTKVGNILKKYY
jgi:NADH-quinone oxidoreductase subunit E